MQNFVSPQSQVHNYKKRSKYATLYF